MAIQNFASKYAKEVDERFTRESQASLALGGSDAYKFTGVKTVNVYSVPVVPMNDYVRSGTSRYGTPNDLGTTVQTLTVSQDRAFTFVIDRGDKLQSQMVNDAGKALSRQVREVWVPEYDSYVFRTLANAATDCGNSSTTAISQSNAYSTLLDAMEAMGNRNVPDKGRVAFCSYKFANLLLQDDSFIRYGDKAQDMLSKGVLGEVDGVKIVKVPAGRLPAGASFILVHNRCAIGPKQLEDYRIHDNPPGINGWLVEGRMIFDCFVLNNKADGLYYHGGQAVLKQLTLVLTATASNKNSVAIVNGVMDGVKRYYVTAATKAALTAATVGTAITVANWTELAKNGDEVTITSGHKYIRVVDVDSDNKPLAVGDAKLIV